MWTIRLLRGRLILSAALMAGLASPALADGFIVPHQRRGEPIPPFWTKYHHVTVTIRDQVAVTSIDQVFVNTHSREVEGTFLFPLPKGAAISEFAMFVGGKKVQGEILDSGEARRLYEDIVRRLRDPALLEYIDRITFRARVFPIPAGGEKRIQLTYNEVLKKERGMVRYLYPLNTERFSLRPLREVSVSVKIDSQRPITNIYSPSHRLSLKRQSPSQATLGFEETDVKPNKDLVLYYAVSADDIGLSFLDHSIGEDRFFMLLAAPRYVESREKVINKNLICVFDSSGSMSGRKIQQTREAARFIIRHLEEGDHFSIIDFDDGIEMFAPTLVSATPQNREKALKFVDGVEDSGGTNIEAALLSALSLMPRGERPNYVLFLTDGLPTVGVTDIADILGHVQKANVSASRLIVFGVGTDVNTELLDNLSVHNRGTSVYVGEDEDLEIAISGYYEKISSPLFSDLALEFRGIEVYQTYPAFLPDLFKGSQLVILGRYRGDGPVAITLLGKVGAEKKTFVLDGQKVQSDSRSDFLPRLWATRRIGFLLEEIRLSGESKELADEVRSLGLRYGIVTPYTSFLVTEREREAIAAAAPDAQEALAGRKTTGAGAVRLAKATQQFKEKEQPSEVISEQVRYKDAKVFYLRDGFWVDSLYQEGSAVHEIRLFSDSYFDLIGRVPGIGPYLSLGRNLIVIIDGQTYKIIGDTR